METIEQYLQFQAERVQQALDEYLTDLDQVPPILKEAMRYSLMAGGKRIRPVLVLATVEAFGEDSQFAMPFACAIEMIHTYSLIHDDLPAMDNDDFRRGKPTNHKMYGEAMAILSGDALLTEAFGLMARGAKEAQLPVDAALTILTEGARAAGASGMVGGQVLDLISEEQVITLEELETIHRHKTGDLIAYSVRAGAILGKADQNTLEHLTRFAYGLGLAFQIQDDILDLIGDETVIGKPVGSDVENQKATYPSLIGLEASQKKLQEVISSAKEELSSLSHLNTERLLEIADYLIRRNR